MTIGTWCIPHTSSFIFSLICDQNWNRRFDLLFRRALVAMGDSKGRGWRWRTLAPGLGTWHPFQRDLRGQSRYSRFWWSLGGNLLLRFPSPTPPFFFSRLGRGGQLLVLLLLPDRQYGRPRLQPLLPSLLIPRPLGVPLQEVLHHLLQLASLGLQGGDHWFTGSPVRVPFLPLYVHLRPELGGVI